MGKGLYDQMDDNHDLMTGNGTENITIPVQVLVRKQAERMRASPSVQRKAVAAQKTHNRRVKARRNKKNAEEAHFRTSGLQIGLK
jgi:hypothetical protein